MNKRYYMIMTDEQRALELAGTKFLLGNGLDYFGWQLDLDRAKRLVEERRRTIFTPCGGKPR